MAKSVRASRRSLLAAFVSRRRFSAAAAAGASLALLGLLQAAPAAAQTPACTGNAPGGELVAQLIYTSTRAENGLFEGPVWTNGSLYFSDFTFQPELGYPSRILRLSQDGAVSTFLDDAGSNGIAVDAQGQLVTANHKYSGIVKINPITQARTTLTNSYNGQPYNSPNDVAIAADGTIYFTDPSYQHIEGKPGQPTTNVYRRAPNGVVTVVDSTLTQPNGVTLSPNGSILYVATGAGSVRAYPIVGGVPQAGSHFVNATSPDGMTVDCFGNLYVTEHDQQRVRVFSPSGQQLALIRVDANVTNGAFGNNDLRTLYMTGQKAVWKIQLSAPGKPY
jgi:gluconolactonase